ncbi:MAG: peptidoglycan DD-metalloendopeptidase family protein [Elainellaceae cyanobacterium]
MATWIKETDRAFYLMEANYYIDKIAKEPRPEGVGHPGERQLYLSQLKAWLSNPADTPNAMVVAVGINAEEPKPKPQLTLDVPESVQVNEVFLIRGQAPQEYAGQLGDLLVEVNGTFQNQTPAVDSKPEVWDDGSWSVAFRFLTPGDRTLRITFGTLSKTFTLRVESAALSITSSLNVMAGEFFELSGVAPTPMVNQNVSLYAVSGGQDYLLSAQEKVNSDSTWVIPRLRLLGSGDRTMKVTVGSASKSFTLKVTSTRVIPSGSTVPEVQLNASNYRTISSSVLGRVTFTGGFMEPSGHGLKPVSYAIFSDDPSRIKTLPSARRNWGIDYVVQDAGKPIRNWYAGKVIKVGLERGYGNRCYVQFGFTFAFKGRSYDVYGAYAHARSFSVSVGNIIRQGEAIGVMGGTSGSTFTFPEHVDFRLWVVMPGAMVNSSLSTVIVDVSPNVIEASLRN